MERRNGKHLDRRSFVKYTAAAAGSALFTGCSALPGGRKPDEGRKRPNIVLVMADDLGVEGLGCYGGESCATPNIDALARGGVRFTQCHSQPLCTASRVKLLTGRSNVYNYTFFGLLDPEAVTFAHLLKQAGYRTCAAGKWQLFGAEQDKAHRGKGTRPEDAGFDEWCLWQVERLGKRYWDPTVEVNGDLLEGETLRGRYGPDLFTEYLEGFMERNRERPFLAYYPMALVHAPFLPTPFSTDRDSGDPQRNFKDMVSYMDHLVGRLVRKLEALGLRQDTLFLFTADNGTHQRIMSVRNGREVKGGKGHTTDRGTHVPLVVNRPGYAAAGTVRHDLVDFSDLLPTLLEAAGVPPPADLPLDGVSFLPAVRGEAGEPRPWIYSYFWPRPDRKGTIPVRFARDLRYKLYAGGALFDLSEDPDEKHPLPPGALPEVRERLRRVIEGFPEKGVKIGCLD